MQASRCESPLMQTQTKHTNLIGTVRDKRYGYKTAWTLVGGYGFTSQQCVAVRYLGLGQYRINESPETLHECHLRDFVF